MLYDPRERLNTSLLKDQADEADQDWLAEQEAAQEEARQMGYIDTVGVNNLNKINVSQNKHSPWRLMFQALKNKGVDKIKMNPSLQGVLNAAQMGRKNQLDAFDANYQADLYQRGRR